MTWPTVAITTTNLDAGTDSPATARADLLDAVTKTNQMIAHVSTFGATVLDDANAATARTTLGAAASGANSDITSINGGPISGFRNVLINGGFTINQRTYVSAAVLASGSFGHDRWKAGSGGGDYSFTQLASDTTITIAANKTLIQVVEDKNIQATSYVLSWTGTAQARYGVNSATPSGAYAASPILITGQTVGTVLSVEFGNGASTGTLGKVQLERATATAQATAFEQRPHALERDMCRRHYQVIKLASTPNAFMMNYAAGAQLSSFGVGWVSMYATPSHSLTGQTVINGTAASFATNDTHYGLTTTSTAAGLVYLTAGTLTFQAEI